MGMIKTAKQEAMLIAKKKSNSLEQSDFNTQMANIQKAKVTNVLTFVKNFGDGITASQSLGYPSRFLGINFSDSWVGCGGFTSAAISCYTVYPAKQK